MMKKLLKKLRSSKGFSMGEMLVATLILGLMTTALASGISSAQRIYYDSVTYSEKRMLLSTICDAIRTEMRYAKEVELVAPQSAEAMLDGADYIVKTYTSPNYGFYAQISSGEGQNPVINKMDKTGTTKTSYMELVGNGVYSHNKLAARLAGDTVYYDKDTKSFLVKVQVFKAGENPNSSDTKVESRTISVKPLEEPELPETTTS